MANQSVAIRLGFTGREDVERGFRSIGDQGDAAAKRFGGAFDRASADVEAAMRRQAAAAAKLASITPQTVTQQSYQAGASTRFTGSSARESAGAFQDAWAADAAQARAAADATRLAAKAKDDLAASAAKLKAAIDPAWAAQQRFDSEMMEARTLIAAGAISLDDYCAKLRVERGLLDASATAQGRAGVSAGVHRSAMQGLSFQAQDTFTQLAAGVNPLSVLAIQGGQAAGQMVGLSGKLGAVANFMVGPWGLAVTGGALALGMVWEAARKHNKELDESVKKAADHKRAAELDRQANERWAASFEGVTEKVRELNGELVRQLQTQGQLDQAKLVSASRGATRERDELQAAYRDRDKARRDVESAKASLKTSGADARIRPALQQDLANAEARFTAANKKIATAAFALGEAQENVRAAQIVIGERTVASSLDAGTAASERYTEALGKLREARRLGQISQGTFERDLRAEQVKRDAAVEAARARNNDRQSGRELTVGQAKSIVAGIGGRVTSDVRSTERQAQLYADMVAGRHKGPVAKPGSSAHEPGGRYEALDVAFGPGISEGSLRKAFAASGQRLTKVLREASQGVFHIEWATPEANREAKTAVDLVEDGRRRLAGLQDQFDPTAAAAREYRDALTEIAAAKLDPATAAAYADAARDAFVKARSAAFELPVIEDFRPDQDREDDLVNSREEAEKRRAEFVRNIVSDQGEALQLAQRELELVGATGDVREREMERLRLKLVLQRDGVDATSAEGLAILANADALDAVNARLKLSSASADYLRDAGGRFIDVLFNPDGSGLKNLLREIESDLLRLALINPLKNWLLGEKNVTLGSVFGQIAGAFGGSKGSTTNGGSFDALFGKIGKNATGTEHWSGGLTWVGENGPELLGLPGGSRVVPAAQSRSLVAANDAGPARSTHNHYDLRGAVVTQELLDQMNAIGAGAAMRGAAAGAALGRAEIQASGMRRLGRRW